MDYKPNIRMTKYTVNPYTIDTKFYENMCSKVARIVKMKNQDLAKPPLRGC